MRQCMQSVHDLINANAKCIWINTYEEESVLKDLTEISTRLRVPMPIYSHSFATGTQKHSLVSNDPGEIMTQMTTDFLLKAIYDKTRGIEMDDETREMIEEDNENLIIDTKNNIFILKDFHLMIDNGHIKRKLRDIMEGKYKNYNTIIIISPDSKIPSELEKSIHIVNYETPDILLITRVIEASIKSVKTTVIELSDDEKHEMAMSLKGLTLNEIAHVLKLSIIKHKKICIEELNKYKIELIKKSSVLDYKMPNASLEDIGGNVAFKRWVDEVVESMSPEAQEFGCAKPKGYLALGIPGAAKTLLAEALASSLGVPFLKLDMSKILDSRVGSSEKNMAEAIRMVKASAPCLLLVDEVEKTLSGMGSSNNSDAGTMARAVGSVLEFLAEDHGVFVVMTSNDVTALPPELTRAGRLDAIWYFGLPTEQERKEIFNIHFKKFGKELSEDVLDYAGSVTSNFTGAEIKEAVKNAVRKAYVRYKKDNNKEITKSDIQGACIEIIPVANSSREKILALEEYAKGRARFANRVQNEYGCNIEKNDVLKSIISMKDIRQGVQ